jgi:hypothetical protein
VILTKHRQIIKPEKKTRCFNQNENREREFLTARNETICACGRSQGPAAREKPGDLRSSPINGASEPGARKIPSFSTHQRENYWGIKTGLAGGESWNKLGASGIFLPLVSIPGPEERFFRHHGCCLSAEERGERTTLLLKRRPHTFGGLRSSPLDFFFTRANICAALKSCFHFLPCIFVDDFIGD